MRFALILGLISCFCILGACGEEDVLAPTTTESGVSTLIENEFPVSWDLFAECVLDGRGEVISAEGTLHATIHQVSTPAGVSIQGVKSTYLPGFSIIGQTSGHTYSLVRDYSNHQVVVWDEGYRVLTQFDNFRIVDDVTGAIYDWPVRLVFVWNAEGVMTHSMEVYPCMAIPAGN